MRCTLQYRKMTALNYWWTLKQERYGYSTPDYYNINESKFVHNQCEGGSIHTSSCSLQRDIRSSTCIPETSWLVAVIDTVAPRSASSCLGRSGYRGYRGYWPEIAAIFEFGRGFYGNTYISVLSMLTLTPTVRLPNAWLRDEQLGKKSY